MAADQATVQMHAQTGGFGDLGRALFALLAPFRVRVQVYDPWLPEGLLRRMGVEPAGFDRVMAENRFVFVMATITTENRHLIDGPALASRYGRTILDALR